MAGGIDIPIRARDETRGGIAKVTKSFRGLFSTVNRGLKGSLGKLGAFLKNKFVFTLGDVQRIIGQVIRSFKGWVDAAALQEEAVQGLTAALKGYGPQAEAVSARLVKFAGSLQQVSTVGDETIIQQQRMLATMGLSEEQIKQVNTAAVELAASGVTSLESASRNLARTFGGMTGELGELIPTIRTLTAEQLRAGEAIPKILETFSGQSVARIATFSGQVDQLTNAWGDYQESVGQAITQSPFVISAIRTAIEIMEKFTGIATPQSARERLEFFRKDTIKRIKDYTRQVKESAQGQRDAAKALAIGRFRQEHYNFQIGEFAKSGQVALNILNKYKNQLIGLDAALKNMDDVQRQIAESTRTFSVEVLKAIESTRGLQAELAKLGQVGPGAKVDEQRAANAARLRAAELAITEAERKALSPTFQTEDREELVRQAKIQRDLVNEINIASEKETATAVAAQRLLIAQAINRDLLTEEERAVEERIALATKEFEDRALILAGDSAGVQAALDVYITKIEEAKASTSILTDLFGDIASSLTGTLGNAISGVFDSLIAGTFSATEAFKSFALSVIKSITGIIAKMIALYLIQKAVGLFNSSTGSSVPIPTAAHGGSFGAGQPVIVGEEGPELFVPRRAGRVVPNNQLGGGGITTNISINIDSDGQSSTTRDGAQEETAKEAGIQLESLMTEWAIRESRPGGLLKRLNI